MKKDRRKNGPTPKQDKWNDPFFRKGIAGRIGYEAMKKLRIKVYAERKKQ